MLELYRFGDFELDGARFKLRRAGRAVVVQPKVLRMLLLLVAERDRVVGTDELFRALWPGEQVGMTSIRRAVRGVRQALGESAESQRSVRTVRGFGYQFVLPVRCTPAQATTPTRIWDAGPMNLSTADTLPLYGRAAELIREEAQRSWKRSGATPG